MPTMRVMSKSPKQVALQALEAARHSLPAYSATRSPKKFTQHQHFAIAALRQFFRVDHRGIAAILEDSSDLRGVLQLRAVPHFSTLAYAEKRLFKGAFASLLRSMVQMARSLGLLPERSRVAIDATGLESRHVSRYFVWRLGGRHKFSTYPKLTVVCDLATHLWLGPDVCVGPCVDSPQFKPALLQAVANQPIDELLGDKGYDAEHNHQLSREQLGIRSTIIAVRRNTNGTRQWPSTPYRREMKRVASRIGYGQRWQVESAFSRNKRLFGSALRARTWPMQQWECQLRVLTHNLMLVAAA